MNKFIRTYNVHDQQQYRDEEAYWKSKTPQEKLHVLEMIRKTGCKLHGKNNRPINGNEQRLQRVLRIVEQT